MLGHQSDQEQTLIMSKVSTIPIHVNLEAQLQVLLIQRFSVSCCYPKRKSTK